MIARICGVLVLALIIPATMVQCEAKQLKGARSESASQGSEAWLTQTQAQHLLVAVESLIRQVGELSKQNNRAPRPDATQPCSPGYPGCGSCDISCILADLCSIQNQLICICETNFSVTDVVGACTDLSVILPTQTDKACIDGLCLSVVSLLKTVLLELRGVFTGGSFPCNVTP